MHTRLVVSLTVTFALVCTLPVHAFGREGHEATGAIAAKLISGTRAEKEVAKILKSVEDLPAATVWADCAKGFRYCRTDPTAEMKEFSRRNPHHHGYHYADVPFEHGAYDEHVVGANAEDVVHTLTQAIVVLQGKASRADNHHGFTQREALFLVAHLTGDIHQPLHVGAAYVDGNNRFVAPKTEDEVRSGMAAETHGGNWLLLGSHNLHGLWDTDLVHRAMRRNQATTPAGFADALLAKGYPKPVDHGNARTWPRAWADEAVKIARGELGTVLLKGRTLVADKDGSHAVWAVTLPRTYIPNGTVLVEKQLYLAGNRLAQVLLAVWPETP
jgi:hypothetical protein